jgi:hypothetical protein
VFYRPHNKDSATRALIQYNFFYGVYRLGQLQANMDFEHNVIAYNWHHMGLAGECGNNCTDWQNGSISSNLSIKNNIFLAYDSGDQAVACWEMGYDEGGLVDNATFANNTCLGMSWAGVGIGDLGDYSSTLVVGLKVYNNIFGTLSSINGNGPGISKNQMTTTSTAFVQAQLSSVGYNSMQGSVPMTQGVYGANANGIPNPEYNRNAWVTKSGVAYNTDGTRNVLGVALQNPTYSTNQTGSALRLTYTSASNMTLAWALDGTNYGAAVQLNWGGSGTTYTVSSVTDPGATKNHIRAVVSGTPFVAMYTTGHVMVNCPAARWAMVVSAAGTIPVGTTFAITGCNGTAGAASGDMTLVPRDSRLAIGDVLAAIKSEARLFDVGATNYVDAGIDARSLPAVTKTDTGIALAMTDYCASGCGAASVVSGLPTSYSAGVSTPLVPLAPPWAGGSAEQAFTGIYYLPSGVAWKTAGSTGSYIGAVPPPSAPNQWPAMLGAWNGLIIQ